MAQRSKNLSESEKVFREPQEWLSLVQVGLGEPEILVRKNEDFYLLPIYYSLFLKCDDVLK